MSPGKEKIIRAMRERAEAVVDANATKPWWAKPIDPFEAVLDVVLECLREPDAELLQVGHLATVDESGSMHESFGVAPHRIKEALVAMIDAVRGFKP